MLVKEETSKINRTGLIIRVVAIVLVCASLVTYMYCKVVSENKTKLAMFYYNNVYHEYCIVLENVKEIKNNSTQKPNSSNLSIISECNIGLNKIKNYTCYDDEVKTKCDDLTYQIKISLDSLADRYCLNDTNSDTVKESITSVEEGLKKLKLVLINFKENVTHDGDEEKYME